MLRRFVSIISVFDVKVYVNRAQSSGLQRVLPCVSVRSAQSVCSSCLPFMHPVIFPTL